MRTFSLLVCVVAVALASSGAGGATFPGRNGLVVTTIGTPYGEAVAVSSSGGVRQPVLPAGAALAGPVVPSPDGSRLAYTEAPFDSDPGLFVASSTGADARRIADTYRQLAPSWSPDGTRLAFTRRPSPEGQLTDAAVDVANVDGSGDHLVSHGVEPLWSPDGRWIALLDGADVVVVTPQGGDRRVLEELTPPASLTLWAAWSPGSDEIAFAEDSRIVVVSVRGPSRRVLADGYYPTGLAWSPAGTTLAFVGSEPGTGARSVFEVPAEGGTPQKILDSSAFFGAPWFTSWSRDGARLLVSGPNDVAVTDAGGALHVLYRGPDYPWQIMDPAAWTPGDTRVVYARVDPGESDLVLRRRNDRVFRRLTSTPEDELDPAWSPDGQHVAFRRVSPGGNDGGLFELRADGTHGQQLTDNPDDRAPSWFPDGTGVVFLRGRAVFSVDTLSGSTRRLRVLPDEGRQVELSPDGRKLAYATSSLLAYVTDLHTRKTRRLTPKHLPGFPAVFDSGVDWSPDARYVAVARGECSDLDCRQGFNTVAVVDPRTGRVLKNPGVGCSTTFSPRGELRCDGASIQPVCTRYGTDRADRLIGGPGRDIICAEGGDDYVDGRGGNDVIIGGAGNDTIVGGPGKDRLFGAWGADRVRARDRTQDVVDGGPGRDILEVDRRLDLVTK